jgi:integrase
LELLVDDVGELSEQVEAIRAAIIASALRPTAVRFRRADAALVSVLAYEGLRPGEAFALHWSDVLERGRPLDRLRITRGLSERDVTAPKSARARAPELFGAVAVELAELYLGLGRPDPRTLVFGDTKGGAATSVGRTGANESGFRRSRPQASLTSAPMTSATRVCDSAHLGRPPVTEVAAHMGHADPGFTARVYGHVFGDAAKRRRVPIEQAIAQARALRRTAEA